MNFSLTEEHQAVQQAARDFANHELLPGVIERDDAQSFPRELRDKIAETGFFGMMTAEKYGGGGMDTISYVLAMEELSRIDASASVMVSVNNSLVCAGIEKFGSEAQKERYLPVLAEGKQIGAFCLSEPEAGSDATQQRTHAVKDTMPAICLTEPKTGLQMATQLICTLSLPKPMLIKATKAYRLF